MRDQPSKRRIAQPLTPEGIARTAIAIADKEGLAHLSMRRLGHELDVEAMAIYHHFANKGQLLEEMLGLVHGEITMVNEGKDWKTIIRSRAKSTLEVLARHPWASNIMESGIDPAQATMKDRELLAQCFREAGFSIESSVHAITLVDVYIYGAVQQFVQLAVTKPRQAAEISQNVMQKFSSEDYPYFSEILSEYILVGKYDPLAEFYFGLEVVLDGIEKLNK